MGFRFEFDPANKILMTRMEGELTDDLVRESRRRNSQAFVREKPSDSHCGMFLRDQILDVC